MRPMLPVFVLLLAAKFSSAGDDQAAAKAIVDKAVKAMGGQDKLAKLKAANTKSEGKILFPVEASYTEESVSQLPDQHRFEMELSLQALKIKQILVFNGAKGWNKLQNNKTIEMPNALVAAFQDYFYAIGLAMNPLELRHKEVMVSTVGEMKIGERDTIGIRASRKDKPEVNLYFDKETGLPAKIEFNAKDNESADKEVPHEFFFSQYKDMDGIRVATEMVWHKDGKKYLTREIKELRPVEKIDPGVFAEP
jgi:hypothetical protein